MRKSPADDRQHRRQAGATAGGDDRPGMLFAQIRRPERCFQTYRITDFMAAVSQKSLRKRSGECAA
jgi:hypothetical protein